MGHCDVNIKCLAAKVFNRSQKLLLLTPFSHLLHPLPCFFELSSSSLLNPPLPLSAPQPFSRPPPPHPRHPSWSHPHFFPDPYAMASASYGSCSHTHLRLRNGLWNPLLHLMFINIACSSWHACLHVINVAATSAGLYTQLRAQTASSG